jgi:benzoyl-CoA reductase/2-hydroxyglutaryl-CoA dehydratase subunit BcrC/BadD/HgdB
MNDLAPPIKSLSMLKEINSRYYEEVRHAHEMGKKIAFVNVFSPAELFYAMDIIPVYPENHSVFLQAKKLTGEVAGYSEAEGYAPEICSYALCDIGHAYSGISPVGGIPKPDLLYTSNCQCSSLTKWFEVLSRRYEVPLFLLDVPFFGEREFDSNAHRYVKTQMNELVALLEATTGKRLDRDRLKEILDVSERTCRYWKDIVESACHTPSPLTVFDQFIAMAPVVSQRGLLVALDFYETLKSEIDDRVRNGIGAVPNERYRLYWDNLPIWPELKWLSDRLASLGACLTATIYTLPWTSLGVDEKDPLDSWARQYLVYFDWHLQRRIRLILELKEKYKLNGFIYHSNRSCKMLSLGVEEIRKAVSKSTGIPGLVLDADHGDPRFYSLGEISSRLESYFEILSQMETKG